MRVGSEEIYRCKKKPPFVKMKIGSQPIFATKGGFLMDTNSLAHTKWNCKHIVFVPKYKGQKYIERKNKK